MKLIIWVMPFLLLTILSAQQAPPAIDVRMYDIIDAVSARTY